MSLLASTQTHVPTADRPAWRLGCQDWRPWLRVVHLGHTARHADGHLNQGRQTPEWSLENQVWIKGQVGLLRPQVCPKAASHWELARGCHEGSLHSNKHSFAVFLANSPATCQRAALAHGSDEALQVWGQVELLLTVTAPEGLGCQRTTLDGSAAGHSVPLWCQDPRAGAPQLAGHHPSPPACLAHSLCAGDGTR